MMDTMPENKLELFDRVFGKLGVSLVFIVCTWFVYQDMRALQQQFLELSIQGLKVQQEAASAHRELSESSRKMAESVDRLTLEAERAHKAAQNYKP
jgi:hypothetical protein